MPFVIPNTTTTSKYQIFAGNDIFANGFFTIANNPAFVSLQHGVYGFTQPGPDVFLPPGTYPISSGSRDPISGVAFKDAVSGSHAQVFGSIYYPGEASIFSGQSFTSIVAAGGGVTPPPAGAVNIQKNGVLVGAEPIIDFEDGSLVTWAVVDDVPGTRIKITPSFKIITGFVAANGVASSGSGYASSRSSAGRYPITFNTAFSLAPVFIASSTAATGNETLTVNAPTTTGGQVNINDAGVAVDRAFFFIAIGMI